MKKYLFAMAGLFLWLGHVFAQDAPNVANFSPQSGNAQQAGKLSSVPVNIFTGVPIISVPIYSYGNANSGIGWNVSLSYFAGGAQMLEAPSTLGIGWSLNATSVISRTVKGMPDDISANGYLYSPVIPPDFRSNGDKYYYDTLDTQQDIFQFSIPGHSGKFYIGKDHQIVITPLSKLKITFPESQASIGMISAFKIVTEDGIIYDFKTVETTKISSLVNTQSGYANIFYNAAWYLTQITAPFSTDSILFNYFQSPAPNNGANYNYPQTAFIRNADGVVTSTYSPTGTVASSSTRINSIVFPDKKTLSFVYINAYPNSTADSPVAQINLSDTIFRYGYKLGYKSRDVLSISYPLGGGQPDTTWKNYRLLLTTVTPYTANGSKKGYTFSYQLPLLGSLSETSLATANQRDYWGFFNAAANGTNAIPWVNGMSWGANRYPNYPNAKASSLSAMLVPDGGNIIYEYELNDHYPYIKDPNSLAIQANTNSQNNITLNQVFNARHQLIFNVDNSVSRIGAPPINGLGNLICTLKSTDGSITYASTAISLYELFYQGIKTWPINIPNGTYRLETLISAGTSFTAAFPINITWENKMPDNTTLANISGGLRIKRVSKYGTPDEPPMIEDYKYITEDGRSSGFLGDIPKYDYQYQETIINGSTTTNAYTAVGSEPVDNLNYAQGSPVGYSRVEVIKGQPGNTIGKTVYEFTGLQDVNSSIVTSAFPYPPQDLKSWGIGLPKKVSVYDNNNTLIKRTVNTYGLDTISYISPGTKSLKIGRSATTYYGNPANTSTPKIRTYLAQEYYPASGRSYLVSTNDTLFQPDGSINTSYKNFTYDANYNIAKVLSSYDKTRGLQTETRLYYPYNYTLTGAIGTLRNNGIITPVIASETWIVGDGNPRIVSGSITDFQTLSSGHIKPLTAYSLVTNAPITQSAIGVFNPAALNRNTTYFKPQQSFVGFDAKANLLQEQSPITGHSNSVIMDYYNLYPIAKISNAANTEVAYTSFEADGSGNWFISNTARDINNAVTGKQSYNLNSGIVSKYGLNTSIPYTLSLWAKDPSGIWVNGVQLNNPIALQNGWQLFVVNYPSISGVYISGYGLIDELRLLPKDANMVTATYDPGLGLITSSADANNTIVYNEYDSLNRIKLIRDKDKNILTRYDYSDPPPAGPDTTAHWVPWGHRCKTGPGNDGKMDSLNININPYSSSYNQTQVVSTTTNYCICSTPALHPDYKMVNGICEQGTKIVTSSIYVKICDLNNSCVWQWRCTYHYLWSDGSVSQDYIIYSPTSCPLGGGGQI